MNEERTYRLQERAAELARTVAFFEKQRERILERRRGAADHVMVELDQGLEVNARMLASLCNKLAITNGQLEAERRNEIRE